MALFFGLNSCATMNMSGNPVLYRFNQSSKLSSAIDMLKEGEEDAAIKLLVEISSGKGVPGVTDEALFRLGLLYLGNDSEIEGVYKAQKTLGWLRREYPKSLWAAQSSGLLEFLVKARPALENSMELRRQIKNLKDLNLYLTRENKKLLLNIEQLKTLDLELEQKARP